MTTAICTLFEGDYHYGVGVLANSLYGNGYRGDVWVGYRGNLPAWVTPLTQQDGYQALKVNDQLSLNFISLSTSLHFSFYKPTFMQELWDHFCPDVETLCYFDPDIVNRGPWDFYERWIARGIALCEDAWADFLPTDHPIRLAWQEYLSSKGHTVKRQLFRYYNAGFVGLPKAHRSVLDLWEKLMVTVDNDDAYMKRGIPHTYPYINAYDQDVLNMTLMVSDYPLTTVGSEGMDFNKRGFLMSHAAGGNIIKPWRKKLVAQALRGVPPSHTDKLFWQYTQTPIQVYPADHAKRQQRALSLASAIGRLVHRV